MASSADRYSVRLKFCAEKRRLAVERAYPLGLSFIPLNGKVPTLKDWAARPREALSEALAFAGQGNVGVRTGITSGVVVVDIDPGCDPELLSKFEAIETPTVKTGRGGRHFYFRMPDGVELGNRSWAALHIDVRGTGGQVVFPGSVHPNTGEAYEWLPGRSPDEITPATWPAELIQEIESLAASAKPARLVPSRPPTRKTRDSYGGAAIKSECDQLAQIQKGGRNHALNTAAFKLGRIVGAGDADERDVFDALFSVAAGWLGDDFTEVEARKTIGSGIRAGKRDPKLKPDLPTVAVGTAPSAPAAPAATAATATGKLIEPPTTDQLSHFMTDAGNGARFAQQHLHHVRYCAPWGKWLIYRDGRWATDERESIKSLATQTALNILDNVRSLPDPEAQERLAKWAIKSQSRDRISAMLDMAKPFLAILPDDLDADPWLLNVANGTIDLRTGELLPHDKSNFITRICRASYNLDAACPIFEQFLQRIFRTHPALIPYFQKVVGYASTGLTTEQAMFFLNGDGSNGKSTLLDAVMHVLGDYAGKTDRELLSASNSGNAVHPTNVADLQGRRLVVCSETNEGSRIDEAKLKDLVGETRVKARLMHKDFFEFTATHKIFLYSNHRPNVRGTDHGFWRRMRTIPFVETILDTEKDGNLPHKLKEESDGILLWMVAGCLLWRTEGLGLPEEVAHATNSYRIEMDAIGSFLSDRCVLGATHEVESAELYEAYKQWCDENGEHVISQRSLGKRLSVRGGLETRKNRLGIRTWFGLSLRHSPKSP